MLPKGLFSQIAVSLLSVLVIFTYIKPALLETKSIQDKITLYEEQQQKVSTVNNKLTTLKSTIDGIDEADKHRLLTYMPNSVDTIAVPRDLSFMVEKAGLILEDVKYTGTQKLPVAGETAGASSDNDPRISIFTLSVAGSYGQVKQLLSFLEQNEYPLEVHDLRITKGEGGFLDVSIEIYTYSRALPETEEGVI